MGVLGGGPEADVEKTVAMPPVQLESFESWLPSEHPLHRPRHGRRQLTALLCAATFFVVPAATLAMGARPAEFENHRLAGFPSLGQGWEFFSGLSDWATDHLPFRDAAIYVADDVSRGVFAEPPPFSRVDDPVRSPPFAPPDSRPEQASPPALAEPPVSAGFAKVIEGKDGWLYYGFDVQGKCKPFQSMDDVIANLVRLRRAVEAPGREFVLVVPPDKTTSVPEHLPDTYVGRSCSNDVGRRFWERVTGEAGAIDLREDLRRITERDGRPPYYPLDTHWDDRAVLTMVKRVADEITPGTSRSWKSEPEGTSSYPADLSRLLGRRGSAEVQMYTLAPDGERDRTRNAAEPVAPVRLTSTPGEGMVRKRVGLLTDSFSLAATRYLPAAFADVDIVYYSTLSTDPGAVLNLVVDQDVIVVEVVERNLTSGIADVVDTQYVDAISNALAAHPRR